jgi:cysteine-S-conjugate beta-lyase
VLPLWVAEMDVPLARPVAAALMEAIELGDTGYAAGATGFAESLAGFAATRWDWSVEVEHTALAADVMVGAVAVLDLVTGPGDAVVVNPPVYPPFFPFIEHSGRRVIEAPLGPDLRLDLDALDAAFARAVADGRSGAYLLCNPHNPTGTVHTADELTSVAELAVAHGVRVVSDEIHAPVVRPGARFVPYLSLPAGRTAFSLVSASKGWNLAGLKAALVVAGPDAVAELRRLPEEVGHGASHLGVIAHTAAFGHGGEWLDAMLRGLERNTRLLSDLLAQQLPDVRYRPGEGTYLAWLDCRELGLGDDPSAALLERARVALLPGPGFGTGGNGHARLNLATTPAVITEAVRRMSTAL